MRIGKQPQTGNGYSVQEKSGPTASPPRLPCPAQRRMEFLFYHIRMHTTQRAVWYPCVLHTHTHTPCGPPAPPHPPRPSHSGAEIHALAHIDSIVRYGLVKVKVLPRLSHLLCTYIHARTMAKHDSCTAAARQQHQPATETTVWNSIRDYNKTYINICTVHRRNEMYENVYPKRKFLTVRYSERNNVYSKHMEYYVRAYQSLTQPAFRLVSSWNDCQYNLVHWSVRFGKIGTATTAAAASNSIK